MNKLLGWTLSTALLIVASLAMTTAPAAAYPGGSCSVVLPSRLAVDAPYERFTARLAGDCAASGSEYASWDVEHPYYGWSSIFIFDPGASSDDWEFYDWEHLGSYVLRPSMAHDADYNDLSQNTVTTSVRLWSRLYLTSARAGTKVTLRSAATRYTPSAEGFRAWAGAPVHLYSRTCGSCKWKYFRMLRTNSLGQASTVVSQRSARYYQARTADVGTTWGRVASTRR